MDALKIVLRLVHISAAIIWGGGALMLSVFTGRAVDATGEAGRRFLQYMINRLRVHIFMTVAAVSTLAAGVLLYWRDSEGFSSSWIRSGPGVGFGIGAIFGVVAFVSGAIFGNGNARLGRIAAQIQGQPTNEQLAQIRVIQGRMRSVSPVHVLSMILAMAFMATARYLVF